MQEKYATPNILQTNNLCRCCAVVNGVCQAPAVGTTRIFGARPWAGSSPSDRPALTLGISSIPSPRRTGQGAGLRASLSARATSQVAVGYGIETIRFGNCCHRLTDMHSDAASGVGRVRHRWVLPVLPFVSPVGNAVGMTLRMRFASQVSNRCSPHPGDD